MVCICGVTDFQPLTPLYPAMRGLRPRASIIWVMLMSWLTACFGACLKVTSRLQLCTVSG